MGPDEIGLDWLRSFKLESNRFPATVLLTSADNDAHFVSPGGELVPVRQVFDPMPNETLAKAVDRWSILESIRRLFSGNGSSDHSVAFLVDLSEASSRDTELPLWIGGLLAEIGENRRLERILLSVSPETLMCYTKAVVPVCRSLDFKHGIRFVLKDVESPAMRKVCLAQLSFDLIVLSKKCTESLVGKERTSMESRKLLEFAFRNNLLTVARGIGDADALHAVISEGIDFVNGDFIAPKQEEVEAAIGIEDGVAGGYSGVAPLSEARHASAATSETWGEGVCRTASGVEKFGCSYSIGPRQLPTSGLRPLRHPVFSRFRRQNPRPKRLQSAGRPRHPGPGDFD